MDARDRLRELFESLDRRRRPEDVAELIVGGLDDLAPRELRTLQKVAGGSFGGREGGWGWVCGDSRPISVSS